MAQSIFDKSIPDLRAITAPRRWGPGERLDHRKLNEPPDAINKMLRGITAARQITFFARPSAGAISLCVVRNAEPSAGSDRVIQISLVEPSESFPEGEAFTIDGELVMANTWPPLRGRHYRAFEWSGQTIADETNVLPAININDAWWVMQYITWGSLDSVSDVPLSDCQL